MCVAGGYSLLTFVMPADPECALASKGGREVQTCIDRDEALQETKLEEVATHSHLASRHIWLRSRGDDTNPGARKTIDGVPLAMHSITTHTAHLPPDDLSGNISC